MLCRLYAALSPACVRFLELQNARLCFFCCQKQRLAQNQKWYNHAQNSSDDNSHKMIFNRQLWLMIPSWYLRKSNAIDQSSIFYVQMDQIVLRLNESLLLLFFVLGEIIRSRDQTRTWLSTSIDEMFENDDRNDFQSSSFWAVHFKRNQNSDILIFFFFAVSSSLMQQNSRESQDQPFVVINIRRCCRKLSFCARPLQAKHETKLLICE